MKSGIRVFLVLPTILLAQVIPSHAQNAQVLNTLAKWNSAAPPPTEHLIKAEVRRTANELYGPSDTCQGSDIVISKVEPATADRFVINGRVGGTLRNAWFVTVQMPRCDTVPVRFMVLQQADSGLKAIRVNRGVSHAWESLVADTFPLARLGAYAALKRKGVNCGLDEKAVLGITRISSEDPALGPVQFGIRFKGSWTEIWPLKLCNHNVEVTVRSPLMAMEVHTTVSRATRPAFCPERGAAAVQPGSREDAGSTNPGGASLAAIQSRRAKPKVETGIVAEPSQSRQSNEGKQLWT